MSVIFLNNQFVPATEAHISVTDRGFLLGDGLFETIRIYKGRAVFFSQHFLRLTTSANFLNIPLFQTEEQLQNIIQELLEKNNIANNDAVVRLTLTRGSGQRGLALPQETRPTLLIAVFPYEPAATHCKLIVSSIRRNELSPLANIKSLNYLDNILVYQEAVKQNADDALMLNTRDNVACTTTANIFMIKDNILFTPKVSDGVLPGIMRGVILDTASTLSITAQEKSISLEELKTADEIFLTNSVKRLFVVTKIDNFYVKNNQDIHLSQQFIDELEKLINKLLLT
jgi:branched-chain amino acid aminotransferase